MTDKQDATRKLPPDEPTQETDKGLRIGIPKRGELFGALKKIARKDQGTPEAS